MARRTNFPRGKSFHTSLTGTRHTFLHSFGPVCQGHWVPMQLCLLDLRDDADFGDGALVRTGDTVTLTGRVIIAVELEWVIDEDGYDTREEIELEYREVILENGDRAWVNWVPFTDIGPYASGWVPAV